jgi:pimeloyl-ACP methyl ester carboxylesterase
MKADFVPFTAEGAALRWIEIAGAQHFVMLDQPEAFARDLHAALG